jgi:transcriptional regulator with XRE-family HTH domain
VETATHHAVSPIALRRFVAGLTQADLAERARISRDTISRLERGDHSRLVTARALARALGTDVVDLFPENEERPAGSPDALQISGGQAGHGAG